MQLDLELVGQKMIRFKKNKQNVKEQSRIEKRLGSLDTSELVRWVDQTLFIIGKNVISWDRTGEAEMLSEAELGAEALHAVIKELIKRSEQ